MAEADVGSLVVRIEADLKNFQTGMNNVSEKVDGFGSTVKKLGGVIAGAFAVKSITDFFKSTIDDAAEAQDNLSALNNVIASTGGKAGVTADQVTDLATSLQKSTKFSDDAVIAGDNLLLTFTSIGKDVFPQATETMLNMSQALGQDVKSSAIQLGKALNDPINGMTALSRVGVSFTQAQKDQIKAMQESGNLMGAQKVILGELNTEFGNAAKAAGETFSGKLERVKNQFGELKESIGGYLLPVLSDLAVWFLDKMPSIQSTVSNAFDTMKTAVSFFTDGFKGEGDPAALIGSWQAWVYKIGEISKTVFEGMKISIKFVIDNAKLLEAALAGVTATIIAQLIVNSLTKLYDAWRAATVTLTTVQWLLNAAMDANPIGIVAVAIGLLIAAGILLYQNWDLVIVKAQEIWAKIQEVFGLIGEKISSIWESIKIKTSEVWNGIVSFFTVTIPQKFNEFITFFSELPGKIQVFLYDLFFVKIPYAIGYGIGFMIKSLETGIPKLIKFFEELPGKIGTWLTETITKISLWGSQMLTEAKEIGKNVVDGIINFVKSLPESIANNFKFVLNTLVEWGGKLWDSAKEIGKNIFDAIVNFVLDIPKKIMGIFNGLIDSIKGFMHKVTGAAESVGKNVKAGVEAGMNTPGFANGVNNFSGGLALVGEHGPELVNLPKGSDVIPNDKSMAMMGQNQSPIIIQNMNVRSDTDIKLIAREIFNLQQSRSRGSGVIAPA